MSTVYSVKETMKIKNEGNYELLVDKLRYQYSLLGALMLNDDAKIKDMTLTADGETYSFKGDVVTPEFKVFLDKLSNAIEISLIAEYEYWWRAGYEHLNVGPFAVCDLAEELLKEGEIEASGFFYAMHNSADCVGDFGALCAYGERNGKQYCGEVKPRLVENFPEDGKWDSAVWPVLCCSSNDTSEQKMNEFIEVCRKFDENTNYTLDEYNNSLDFELKETRTLTSREDFESFATLCTKLHEIAEEDYSLIGQFVDTEGDVPRLLEFDINDDGSYTIKMAAV